jgi:hypothetical protein
VICSCKSFVLSRSWTLKIRPCGRSIIEMCPSMIPVGDLQTRDGERSVEQQKDGTIYLVPDFGANLPYVPRYEVAVQPLRGVVLLPLHAPRRHHSYPRMSALGTTERPRLQEVTRTSDRDGVIAAHLRRRDATITSTSVLHEDARRPGLNASAPHSPVC